MKKMAGIATTVKRKAEKSMGGISSRAIWTAVKFTPYTAIIISA